MKLTLSLGYFLVTDMGTELETYGPTYRLWANSESELTETLGGLGDCLDKCAKPYKDMVSKTFSKTENLNCPRFV